MRKPFGIRQLLRAFLRNRGTQRCPKPRLETCWMKTRLRSEVNNKLRANCDATKPKAVRTGWCWTLFFSIAKRDEQVFDGPVRSFAAQGIGGGAVLPYAVAKCRRWIGLQLRLGQQSPQVPGQHITAAALRQKRVAGTVVKDRAFASADECLVA